MTEPKLTEAQKALLPSIDAFAEGRSNYGAVYDTVARMVADAEKTARADREAIVAGIVKQAQREAWDEGNDAGYDDPRILNPYRSTP